MRLFIATAMLAATAFALPGAASAQALGTNLIRNGDAETGTTAGFATTGNITVIPYNSGGGYPGGNDAGVSAGGGFLFVGGSDSVTTASQTISLALLAGQIDGTRLNYLLSGFLGGYSSQDDNASLLLSFLGAGNVALGSATLGPVTPADRSSNTGLLFRSTSGLVPVGTRSANVLLTLSKFQGGDNDGYADNLSFSLTPAGIGAVPEPASWAMMVIGFGGLGAAMRRRKRQAVQLALA